MSGIIKILIFMRKLLFIFIFIFPTQFANAQFALLRMNVGDCPKCVYGFQVALEKSASKLPVFTIFPYYAPKDQLKIKSKMGDFAKFCPPIFDDALYKQSAKVGQQGIYYFSKEGEIVYQKPLLEISEQTVLTLDSIYDNDFHFKAREGAFIYSNFNSEFYQQDWQLSEWSKLSNNAFEDFFSLNDATITLLKSKIETKYPNHYRYNAIHERINNMEPNQLMRPTLYFAHEINGKIVLTISLSRLLYLGTDTANIEQIIREKNDEKLGLINELVQVELHNDTVQDVSVIEMYNNNDDDANFTIRFTPLTDSTFLSLIGNPHVVPESQFFFSVYNKHKLGLSFNKKLPIAYPKDYAINKGNPGELVAQAISYPYFFPMKSQYVIDLSSNKSYAIEHLFGDLIYENLLTNTRKKLDNRLLIKADTENHYYLISKLGDVTYCFLIDMHQKKVLHRFALQGSKLPTHTKEYPVVLVDANRKRFFLEDPENKVRAYPLVFLEQMQ